MGSAILFTAAHMQEIEDATVTSMTVNGSGHLIVTRHDGSTFDAGDVSTWLPGRLRAANNLGPGNDPNALLDSGWYAGTTWANSLSGYNFGVVEVLAYDGNYIVQNFWTAEATPRRFNRTRHGGTWTNWVEKDAAATTALAGEVRLADSSETISGASSAIAVTPAGLATLTATSSRKGLAEFSTDAESITGTASDLATTPASVKARLNDQFRIGTIDPYWTYGQPTVTLDDGVTTVSAYVSPSDPDIQPGALVKIQRSPTGLWIIDSVYSANPKYLKWVPVPYVTADWKDYDAAPGGGGFSDLTYTPVGGNYSLPKYDGPLNYIGPNVMGVTKTVTGWVLGKGMIYTVAGVAANTTIATLPVGFRPLYPFKFTNIHGDVYLVGTDGTIKPISAVPAARLLILSNMRFQIGGTSFTNLGSFQNGWASSGGIYRPTPRVGKDGMGFVFGQGALTGGTATDLTSICAMPAGYTPKKMNHFTTAGSSTPAGFRVDGSAANGSAAPYDMLNYYSATGYTNNEVQLDGVCWEDIGSPPAWQPAAMVPSAAQYAGSTLYSEIGFCKTADGLVHLKGLIGGFAANATLFYLPPGMRPLNRQVFMVSNSSGTVGRLDVMTNGAVAHQGGGTTWTAIDGLMLVAEQ